MHENLQRLTHALRAEKCPPGVLERVQTRITRHRASRQRISLPSTALAVSMGVLAVFLAVWVWPHRITQSLKHPNIARHADRIRVAKEAGAALGYIGTLLLNVGEQAQNALVNDAVPPLRSGLETVSKTLNQKL
jgi:hypothetical protein